MIEPRPDRLPAIEAIRRLKAAYFRHIDLKDWDGLAGLFEEDATLDGGAGERVGRDTIVGHISRALADVTTVHHGHLGEIDVHDDGTATGVWAMEDILEWPAASAAAGAPVGFHGYGHYHDTYRRGHDGRWRFRTVVLRRLRVDPMAGGERPGRERRPG